MTGRRKRMTHPSNSKVTGRRYDAERKRDVINRQSINVQSFMIERRFCHHDPFEYEYEHRCTEHEHDGIDSLTEQPGGAGVFIRVRTSQRAASGCRPCDPPN